MALRGTLKDFGIADIFQLVGHQGKTGRLSVKKGDQQVDVYFFEGSVVRAQPTSREAKDLFGSMLVRAEVVTQAQLDRALEQQRGGGRRLGDILAEIAGVEPEALNSFAKLQTNETLYRLFLWDSGTYE